MKFFHVYNEDCFKGLEKNNMLNGDSGFKIQNVFSVPYERQFNNIAAIGGTLHSMIKNDKIPFYVDRIAGGITYWKYEYDKTLIKEYRDILGDWFLGFQLHESASNRRTSDWPLIIKTMGSNGPYDVKAMDEPLKSSFAVTPYGEVLHGLSQGSISEYSKLIYSPTPEGYYEEIKEMFKTRMEETEGLILPCDSYYLMTKLQDELGMKTFMPEVGSQIPYMRTEVALARGIAKASDKTWGTYYECWHWSMFNGKYVGCTMPCFNLDPINEWYLTQDTHPDNFTSFGENGGSSRLLQNRIYYFSLMSGSHYFSEEWGLNCSYYDMKEFNLSPYGETKKNFIHEAEKLRGINAFTPFAIVLPKKYSTVQLRFRFNLNEKHENPYTYMCSTLTKQEEQYYMHVEDVLALIFEDRVKGSGNEGHVLTNTEFGDVFDIIYEDTNPEAMKKYEYLIDASPDSHFKKENEDKYKILDSSDINKLSAELKKLILKVMPVYVSGLSWLVSTDENNQRYLSLFNNEGNMRTIDKGDVIDNEADELVEVTFKKPTEIEVIKEGNFKSQIIKKDDKTYSVKVPATAFIILEF